MEIIGQAFQSGLNFLFYKPVGCNYLKRQFECFLCSKTEQKKYREPFLMKFFLLSIQFSNENHSN